MQTVLYFQSPSITSREQKLAGVLEIAAQAGWHVQVTDIALHPRNVRDLVAFWKPIGVIVESGGCPDGIDPSVFGRIPTVFLDRNPATLLRGSCCVSHDSTATAQLAAKELLATGYGNFAYVHAPGCPFWSERREEGFRTALEINGKTPACLRLKRSANGLSLQRSLRGFLATLPLPCAVFAANDQTASELLTAAKQLDLRVPGELAVVGVDNRESICEHTNPPLTSVVPDFRGGAVLSALMLQKMIGGVRIPVSERKRTFGPLRIVRRASTRVIGFYDRDVATALDLIARESCQGLAARDVLRTFPCSRGEAERRFRRATSMSILQAIHETRLARIRELLRIPNLQLKVIGDFCGFKTPGAVRKFFRQQTGQTLSAERRSCSPVASVPSPKRNSSVSASRSRKLTP